MKGSNYGVWTKAAAIEYHEREISVKMCDKLGQCPSLLCPMFRFPAIIAKDVKKQEKCVHEEKVAVDKNLAQELQLKEQEERAQAERGKVKGQKSLAKN
ncbi:hypothetical protein L2E82_16680 [Cichorium intybus]|uniref:Uncharacterized protein n=1 Tax=Cichorium intybus TaxID=13427 RepID=A0ACB9F6R7_CICIN|nr:hypothetical protein L2E82_16680 [Cichorium intybus]